MTYSNSGPKTGDFARRPWGPRELERLVELAQANHSAAQIGRALDRTPKAVRNMASQLGVELKWRVVATERKAAREGDGSPRKALARLRRGAWKLAADFDFSELTFAQRRALAERLLASIPPDNPDLQVPPSRDPKAVALARYARRKESLRKWLSRNHENRQVVVERARRREPQIVAELEAERDAQKRLEEQRAAKLAEVERRIEALTRGEVPADLDSDEELEAWDELP